MSPMDILEKCNYIIKYYYNNTDNFCLLKLNLKSEVVYKFTYGNGLLESNYKNLKLRASKIAVLPYLTFFIEEICQTNQYPIFRVKKYYNGNPCNQFKFNELNEDDTMKQMYLTDLIVKYQKYGLRPDLVSESYGLDLAEDLLPIVSYDLGLSITNL